MAPKFEFTLQQLAQIALGTEEFGEVNIAAMHTLMDILLRKLNCGEDEVTFGGLQCKAFERALKQSKGPLPVTETNPSTLNDRLNKIDALNERLTKISQLVDCHFQRLSKIYDLPESDPELGEKEDSINVIPAYVEHKRSAESVPYTRLSFRSDNTKRVSRGSVGSGVPKTSSQDSKLSTPSKVLKINHQSTEPTEEHVSNKTDRQSVQMENVEKVAPMEQVEKKEKAAQKKQLKSPSHSFIESDSNFSREAGGEDIPINANENTLRSCNPYHDSGKYLEYVNLCEDVCAACLPEYELACSLLENRDFMKKLLRMIAAPMTERLMILEQKISKFGVEFDAFMTRAQKRIEQLEVVQRCVEEIEQLRYELENHLSVFHITMEEVQDLLDAKLPRQQLPELKKFINSRFELLEKQVTLLDEKTSCTRATGIVMPVTCLSCGDKNVCADLAAVPTGMLPSAARPKGWKRPKPPCSCTSGPNTEEIPVVSELCPTLELHQQTVKFPAQRIEVTCRSPDKLTRKNYIMGDNGSLYLKG